MKMAISNDMIEKTMDGLIMDDCSVFGDSFSTCLTHLEKIVEALSSYAFEKISVISCYVQSIVYTDHFCHQVLFAKKDAIARPLSLGKIRIKTTRGKNEIDEALPLETLGSICYSDQSTMVIRRCVSGQEAFRHSQSCSWDLLGDTIGANYTAR
ncbi:hypothetical protein Tco_1438612 [Tanacetum coccineum]